MGERIEMVNSSTHMKQKINYIVNLRVFACIGVILCHVAANNWYGNIESKRWIVLTAYLAFSRFCVPIFLMISGVLFLRTETRVSFRKIYAHNILKLCVFLLFWGMCYQIYNLTVAQKIYVGEGTLWTLISEGFQNVFRGETQAHLWYIYTIIGLYMIVPLLKPWINNLSKKEIEYFLVLYFIFNVIYSVICNLDVEAFKIICNFSSRLSINIVGGYIGYLVLGYYLDAYELPDKMRKICYALGVAGFLFSAVLTVFYSRHLGAVTEIFWNYCSVFVFFWSIAVFVFFRYNLDQCYKAADIIANYTLGIYACHMFVVFELWRNGISTFSFSSIFSVPVITVLVFICALGFTYVIGKIPFLRKWII